MICPYCNIDDDRVIDSRAAEGGDAIRRRRECAGCGKRFTTYERVERTARLMVVKRDGSRVAFDQESILKGIQAACGKRPVPESAKLELAQLIEEDIHREFDHEVDSVEIGRRVAARLHDIDPVAYIRYAIEYYGYETLDDVAGALNDLQDRPRNLPNQVDLFDEDRTPRPTP